MYTPFPLNERGLISKGGGGGEVKFMRKFQVYSRGKRIYIKIKRRYNSYINAFFLFSYHFFFAFDYIIQGDCEPHPTPSPIHQCRICEYFFLQIARLWVSLVFMNKDRPPPPPPRPPPPPFFY